MLPQAPSRTVRVALVHDYLNQYGGAERVLEALHDIYPDAPVYTSLYDRATMPAHFGAWDIRTSFLQRVPLSRRFHRAMLMLYPLVFESFDLTKYDVVISNSSAWAKAVITPPDTLHVCYCLAPMRFAWTYQDYVERERLGGLARRALPSVMHYLRIWDTVTADRVDRFIGISRAVVARIQKYYRREADLIAPPVDVENAPFSVEAGDNFLVVSRLVPYKRVDLAVDACTRHGLPLEIVGDGRDRSRLESAAGPTVRFRGHLSDDEVRLALSHCRAFLFPGEEDFGIAPIEAMAAGRAVIAYAGGGALDTMVDGVTGRFFSPQTPEALAEQLLQFRATAYSPSAIREHAMEFDTRSFQRKVEQYVDAARQDHVDRGVATAHGPVRP
ncbi:MAG: glycosyltransferase family 4 protein [Chloroflexi bacterium]|nr:glycosyltransferase family 4 protein [Chloroflexota bacterium]